MVVSLNKIGFSPASHSDTIYYANCGQTSDSGVKWDHFQMANIDVGLPLLKLSFTFTVTSPITSYCKPQKSKLCHRMVSIIFLLVTIVESYEWFYQKKG